MTTADSGDRRPAACPEGTRAAFAARSGATGDRTDASLPPTETQAYVAEWRAMEDRFYRAVMGAAELYMLGIRLVRAIADTLAPVDDLAALVERFGRTGTDDVVPIADALDAPQVVLLDYQLALATAFYLRAQEIQDARADADLQQRVEGARAQGHTWVVLADRETRRYGKVFFQRLEMHLPDGFGLLTASEMDWERGRIYVVEPLLLDPQTGRRRTGTPPLEPPRVCATPEEMRRVAAQLRQKYTPESAPSGWGEICRS
jgi:hypothetical protein